jgi:hypothetical protein
MDDIWNFKSVRITNHPKIIYKRGVFYQLPLLSDRIGPKKASLGKGERRCSDKVPKMA